MNCIKAFWKFKTLEKKLENFTEQAFEYNLKSFWQAFKSRETDFWSQNTKLFKAFQDLKFKSFFLEISNKTLVNLQKLFFSIFHNSASIKSITSTKSLSQFLSFFFFVMRKHFAVIALRTKCHIMPRPTSDLDQQQQRRKWKQLTRQFATIYVVFVQKRLLSRKLLRIKSKNSI